MMRSMGRVSRLALAVLILAAAGSAGVRAAAYGEGDRAGHCGNVASPSHLHVEHNLVSGRLHSDAGAHRCPACDSGRCPASAHCISTGAIALVPAEAALLASSATTQDYGRAFQRRRPARGRPA